MKKIASELLSVAKDVLAEGEPTTIFDINNVNEALGKLKTGIKAPHVWASSSALGGPEHVSIYITVSLDDRKDWSNGIMENSRYYKMSLSRDGTLKLFSGGTRKLNFRKTRVKSIESAIEKINKFNEEGGKIEKWY